MPISVNATETSFVDINGAFRKIRKLFYADIEEKLSSPVI
jgi:hypothetical protein